jgi:predicted ATPase
VPAVTAEGYVGIDVHRGARVAALAHGGQILLSPATAALLEGEQLLDLGVHRLKDFEGSTRLYQLGLGRFPPLRTPGSVELPSPPTRFLGRERELFEAVSLVYERDPRVLTITGPGGTGKTRFAIELARLLADEADGATLFVPFAPVRDGSLVLQTIGDRLGMPNLESAAVAAAIGRRRTHLLLDNLEHLLPAASRPLADLVAAAPMLRAIATSREPLRIQGEIELDLPPLANDEAEALFLERARAVRSDATTTPAVGELCQRLDCLPLALELAAARTKLLAPEQLLERLDQRLDLLKGTRDADERQATLRATIAWSYDLLDEGEQVLFATLSVFAAGCTLESAEAVCDADLDTLASLLDKSLLRRRTGRLGEERFWMLETIRRFAAERLEESDHGPPIRRRHAERMLAIASAAHLSEDDDEPFDLPVALAERDDLRVALDWASEHDDVLALELAVALENFWNAHAPDEGTSRVGLLLESAESVPPLLRARALRVHAGAAHILREYDLADASYEESLRLFTELGNRRGVALLQHRLAVRALNRKDLDDARRLADASEENARGDFPLLDTQNTALFSYLASEDGNVEGALELATRSKDLAHELGWTWWESRMLDQLLRLNLDCGDLDEAERVGRDALRLERENENRTWASYTLIGLAQVALARGLLERAGTLWGSAGQELTVRVGWDELRVSLGGTLLGEDRPAFLAGCERGKEVDIWEAVAIALGEDGYQTVP